MREPDVPAQPAGVPADPAATPSPLDVLPGLGDLAHRLADAVMVTDLERRIVVWNESAERLYGIGADVALGARIETLYDSTIVGEGTSSAGARDIAVERGSWRGRVADVPRSGRFAGQELVIEAVLSRLDGPDGTTVGVISVKRDITSSVRLERELSTLGSLATATGEARSRATQAQRALDVVAATTGADHGSIILAHGRVGRMIARKDVPAVLEHIAGDVAWEDAPAIRALTPIGRVIRGTIDRLPLDPVTRRELMAAGIRSLLVVGLHRDEELIGVLSLAWDRDDAPIPSEAMALLVATTIARGLENARLVEEIMRRAEDARQVADRLRKIDDLTRAGASVQTIDELAERSGRLINKALGAAGTFYGILGNGGVSFDTSSIEVARPSIERWLRDHGPDLRPALQRWRAGEGAYFGAFEPGIVPSAELDVARKAGITAYAFMPIRIGDDVVGGIAAYFDRPLAELHLDRRDLDRVASTVSMALENLRLREAVADADERYRALFEGSRDPMMVALPDGTLVDANDEALRLFGTEREWLLGRRPEEIAVYEFDEVASRLADLNVGESFAGNATGIRRDGRRVPLEVETTLVLMDGEPRLLARIRDLTEQERLQGQLAAAQKLEAAARLVPGIAHELNNPLASIVGFSELIRRDPSLPDDLRLDADLLVAEATRTERLIRDLLDFVGRRPAERHPTSVRALIESVLSLQSYDLGSGPIQVEVHVPDDLPPVELDRGQLQQVLVSLTQNAIHAVREGGGSRVTIQAARSGTPGVDERVSITVIDDGPGVAPEQVDRLFAAFYTTKPPGEGSGLGLSVSEGLIRSHAGTLRYSPSPLGRGAAFTIELPVSAASSDSAAMAPLAGLPGLAGERTGADATTVPHPTERAAPAPTPVRSAPTGAGRILVLDDDSSFRTFLEKALVALGYEPVMAAKGPEVIERVAAGDHAAVLCDNRMPDMSGIEVYKAVAAIRPDLARRFVLMSGDVVDAAVEAFAETHEVTRLAKPFDLDTLDRTLRAVIDQDGQPRG